MTPEQLTALAVELQDFRDWCSPDLDGTIEEQYLIHLVSFILDQVARLRSEGAR